MTGAFPGSRANCPASPGMAAWLSLAAAPIFAAMALLTHALGRGPTDGLCSSDGFALGGVVPMYLLMSGLHLPPWLKLVSGGRSP